MAPAKRRKSSTESSTTPQKENGKASNGTNGTNGTTEKAPESKKPTESKKSSDNIPGTSNFLLTLSGIIVLLVAAIVGGSKMSQQAMMGFNPDPASVETSSDHGTVVGTITSPPEVKKSTIVKVFLNGEHEVFGTADLSEQQFMEAKELGHALSPLINCTRTSGGAVAKGLDSLEPCTAFNEVGQMVKTVDDVGDRDTLYLVPPDRLFVWPTVEIGRRVKVSHVTAPQGVPIEMETLSLSPRVYMIHNFMDYVEADTITREALEIKDDEHRLKRSSTGTAGRTVSSSRTSENAFITDSPTAMNLKKRIFSLLGIPEFENTMADGIQVLRYNISKAYIAHLDYLDPPSEGGSHDFDSGGLGSNRFATVILYFNDVEEGGETVFVKSQPTPDGLGTEQKALDYYRNGPGKEAFEASGIVPNSWEENLNAQCKVRLAVKPVKGAAALFYSQLPNGKVDNMSTHGACPVLRGQKWAANLWVWNAPRYTLAEPDEFGRMVKKTGVEKPINLIMRNEDVPNAELYYLETLWGEWAPGQEFRINSFEGHKWYARVQGHVVKGWQVPGGHTDLKYTLTLDLIRDALASLGIEQ